MLTALSDALCYRLALRAHANAADTTIGAGEQGFDRDAYVNWRRKELETQFAEAFPPSLVAGKDIVDFGAGTGALSFYAARLNANSVRGVDLSADDIDSARAAQAKRTDETPVSFIHATKADAIPLNDDCCDVILCFDVVEHIIDYEAIFAEWRRILRPGGAVAVWWVPYFHPYGHHVEALAPVPWAHAIFPERSLLRTCARIYDSPAFAPRHWDLDENGRKKPNKWKSMTALPTLNKLTINAFERCMEELGFHIERRELHPFSGGGVKSAISRLFTKLPVTQEFFTAHAVYLWRAP
ncbi:MAG: class I SAM-dependent methyltransferase [Pseudomonadota bacterium]